MTTEVRPSVRTRTTIRDVARAAGVSIGTVSAVINARDRVAESTRRQVLRCIEDLGFEPNNSARSLKSGRIASIGFIVPDLRNPFFAGIAEGIQLAIGDQDILFTLCLTWARADREDYYARVLRTQRLDGVIYLSATGLPSLAVLDLADSGSVVFVDEILPGIETPFVGSNNIGGARAIARHVIEAGHRRIGIVRGPVGLWTSDQRHAGYREALAAAALDPDEIPVVTGDYGEASGYRAAKTLLASAPGLFPTAILCANDMMAMGVMRYCRDAGIRIPTDISIGGFDDIPGATYLSPSLTTVSQPSEAMGRAAGELLLHRIGSRAAPPDTTIFPTHLRIRNSVGPSRV